MKRRWKQAAGFTLVELIVVIAILGILAGVAVPTYSGYVKKANLAADQTLVDSINTAFAAACIENQVDISTVRSSEATITINRETGAWTPAMVVGEVTLTDDFKTYMGGDASIAAMAFKAMTGLIFDESLDRFVESESTSNFEDEAVMNEMRLTLDGIAVYFRNGLGMGLQGEDLKAWLTAGMNDDLKNGLGLDSMADGYNAAMELSDTELDTYLKGKVEGYADMDETMKANYRETYKANLGVMYFAEDAANRSTEAVMSSVENFMTILTSKDLTVSDAELEAYYLATADPEDIAEYQAAGAARKAELLSNFSSNQVISLGTDLNYTGKQAAAMAVAAKNSGATNTAGVSMLGSMYALAAGYYNSDYYNPETDGTKPNSYGDFDSITKAMENESFFEYYFNQGQTDVEYYLNYMASLSGNPNLDLSNSNAFAGLNGQG